MGWRILVGFLGLFWDVCARMDDIDLVCALGNRDLWGIGLWEDVCVDYCNEDIVGDINMLWWRRLMI